MIHTEFLKMIFALLKNAKLFFNPDIMKQSVEIIFSGKMEKLHHPSLDFNNIPVARKSSI